MVARDGIEPPTPAFSGLLTDSSKWFRIRASDNWKKTYEIPPLGPFGLIWAVFASTMFPYCSPLLDDNSLERPRGDVHEGGHLRQGFDHGSEMRNAANRTSGIRFTPRLGTGRGIRGYLALLRDGEADAFSESQLAMFMLQGRPADELSAAPLCRGLARIVRICTNSEQARQAFDLHCREHGC